ncbi:hypothetical protein BV25DRAFT_1817786 [Artomyces pyxidatus]|uniref:Uncharacterized protein n=1 Tax=Artomyces pyxidatus TaxID=48021 RepID=A0ACB8TK85_9AGAM|nr:hypothetical protein BV25DRAFT_1817786 [Artomyces pyxidatus]
MSRPMHQRTHPIRTVKPARTRTHRPVYIHASRNYQLDPHLTRHGIRGTCFWPPSPSPRQSARGSPLRQATREADVLGRRLEFSTARYVDADPSLLGTRLRGGETPMDTLSDPWDTVHFNESSCRAANAHWATTRRHGLPSRSSHDIPTKSPSIQAVTHDGPRL